MSYLPPSQQLRSTFMVCVTLLGVVTLLCFTADRMHARYYGEAPTTHEAQLEARR